MSLQAEVTHSYAIPRQPQSEVRALQRHCQRACSKRDLTTATANVLPLDEDLWHCTAGCLLQQ